MNVELGFLSEAWRSVVRPGRKEPRSTAKERQAPRSEIGNHRAFPLLGDAWASVQPQPRIDGEDRIFPFNSKSVGASFTRACINLGSVDLFFHDITKPSRVCSSTTTTLISEVAAVTFHSS